MHNNIHREIEKTVSSISKCYPRCRISKGALLKCRHPSVFKDWRIAFPHPGNDLLIFRFSRRPFDHWQLPYRSASFSLKLVFGTGIFHVRPFLITRDAFLATTTSPSSNFSPPHPFTFAKLTLPPISWVAFVALPMMKNDVSKPFKYILWTLNS